MQEIGTEEVDSLRGGVYEVRKSQSTENKQAKESTAEDSQSTENAEGLTKSPGDRSMARVGRGKTKRK